MKITIEADIKGEDFPPEVHERVINMGMALTKETNFMPETHTRVHINDSGQAMVLDLVGRLEYVKGYFLYGSRNDKS